MLLAALAGCASTPVSAPPQEQDWFIFLESGKKTPDDKVRVAQMQRGHLENFKRLFGEKKLVAAGPLRDPSGATRGIVVVKAPDRATLESYFQPDEFVRDGFMTLIAAPVRVMKPLSTEGIDANSIEEVRIVLVMRTGARDDFATRVRVSQAVESGLFGAWYHMQEGIIGDVLFTREKDAAAIRIALGWGDSGNRGTTPSVTIWPQWLSKGVVR